MGPWLNKKNIPGLIAFVVFFIIFSPFLAMAQDCGYEGNGKGIYCLNINIGEINNVPYGPGANPLGTYVSVWYSFIIGGVGIIATVMIMWSGFKWLTSQGNSGKIGEAKEGIQSALIGLALAFLSFTILQIINPNLLSINTPGLEPVDYKELPGSQGTPTSGDTPGSRTGESGKTSKPCENNSNNIIDFGNTSGMQNPGVNFTDEQNALFDKYGKEYGVSPNILRAIAAAESRGKPETISNKGAAGLMQILPSTASWLAGRDVGSQELISNQSLSIELAAKYISKNQSGLGRSDIFAGYNAGYSSKEGRALGQSRDCPTPGVRGYQCCINPGGLVETQNYVANTNSYYNYYNETYPQNNN